MKKETTRQSNFELMRIVAMFMIVLGHFIVHGYLRENTTGTLHLILQFIMCIVIVHVNSFVLLSGYFQCKSKMKLGKVIKLNNSMWFYKVSIMIVFIIIGSYSLSIVDSIKMALPINYGYYWFIINYMILYLISPILNIVINNVNKTTYKKIIISLFIIMCIFAPFTNEVLYNNSRGYSLGNFILLYFIGAYFRIYDINKNIIMKKLTVNAKRLLYLFAFLFIALFNFSVCKVGENLVLLGSISKEIGSIIVNASIAYDNPLIVIQTIFFFLFFRTFCFKSKFINWCARYVFGVYLISENPLLREKLYSLFKLYPVNHYGLSILYKIIIYSIIVFTVCIIIEFIRQLIFKFIYNRKFSKKLRCWYQNYFKSLGLDINW